MNGFKELGIDIDILKSIENEGFDEPTEIQVKSIPVALQGKDIIAGSATGSGKTLAFGAGIIQNTVPGNGIQALILAPTRELAEQIQQSLKKFSKHKKLKICAIYGGVSINPQFTVLEKADVVVGTPGRILDHLERGTINLRNTKCLVLDEADRMLDMGFLDDVRQIMGQCPREKQTLLFSATINEEIKQLSKKFMNSPVNISLNNQVDPKKLTQIYYDVSGSMKFSLLVHLIKEELSGLIMIFCNSRVSTDFVEKNLRKAKIDAIAIHGGLSQNRRTDTLSKFNSNKALVLVCTDVAARGLDVPNVTHVYNYDIPHDTKQYIHRIGRTARAGKDGKVINLISQRDYDNFSRVLQECEVKVTKAERPKIEKIEVKQIEKPSRNRSMGRPQDSSRSGHGRRTSNRSEGYGRPSSPRQSSGPRSSGPQRNNSNSNNSR